MTNNSCLFCGLKWPDCGCTQEAKHPKFTSTKAALDNYFKKQASTLKPKRKYGKPEKLVEADCLVWMRQMNWSVQIYEAKNTFNPRTGKWSGKAMQAGTVDCQGVMPSGRAVAIEFKAKGKLRTFLSTRNLRQIGYLNDKINSNAFATVVSAVDELKEIYLGWLKATEKSDEEAKQFLFDCLPGNWRRKGRLISF